MDNYINPKILTWARERMNLSVEDLAAKMHRPSEEILLWEKGEKTPSYGCLEDLAYKHFGIPLALFYFPEPPDVPDPINKFRRLPDFELEKLSDDTIKKIRYAQAYQDSLAELLEGYEFKRITDTVKYSGQPAEKLSKIVREYLNFPSAVQFGLNSASDAFKHLRGLLEEAGIFTFKDSFKDKYISGFSLYDDSFPIIVVNNSTSFSRQVFTLIHELGHILLGVNGVTDVDETYFTYLSSQDKNIETYCNRFAGNFLVPEDEFHESITLFKKEGISAVSKIAKKFSVSREVVLRRLLDVGIITDKIYKEKSAEWTSDYYRHKKDETGGSYYLTKISYLGENYIKIAFDQYRAGRIDRINLANHLNVKSKNIESLESYVSW